MNTDGNEGTVPLPEGELGETIASLFSRWSDTRMYTPGSVQPSNPFSNMTVTVILIEKTNEQEEVIDFRCPSARRIHACGIL